MASNYLYTVQTFQRIKGVEGETSCLQCRKVVTVGRHRCVTCQVESFAIWQVAHKLGLELDDVVYLRKEKLI